MHKCVRCGSAYDDDDAEIIRGCKRCGGIFFLYVAGPSDAGVKQLDAVKRELEAKDTTIENELAKEIGKKKAGEPGYAAIGPGMRAEKPAYGHVELEAASVKRAARKAAKRRTAKPAAGSKLARKDTITIGSKKFALDEVFGIETVRMPNEGVYEINIDALMRKRPIILLERGGIYVIHLPQAFQAESKTKPAGRE